ncbi:hypothetical protein [Gloeocapsa sp. PCC 73106]|uniref:hypothetical protein n=1 Tax=Gloeocapsa sp. PCC 73106 TaxID=102232 RepID=UPI0005507B02|nr:hypothetical protein [Gloeocapsa sp. PCC 73106]
MVRCKLQKPIKFFLESTGKAELNPDAIAIAVQVQSNFKAVIEEIQKLCLTGLLVGLGALAIPGVGPIMLAGAVATALATTAARGVSGVAAGSLLGGLFLESEPKSTMST